MPKYSDLTGAITEKQFQNTVLQAANILGWTAYHTHDSRKSAPGFPDLVMIGHGRQIVAELKTEKGRVSPYQAEWMALFESVESAPEVFLWRPSDLDAILDVFRGA